MYNMIVNEWKNKKIAVWGAGYNLQSKKALVMQYIFPQVCIDSNEELWGKEILPGVVCESPKVLNETIDIVVITPEKGSTIASIRNSINGCFEIYTLNEVFDVIEIERQKSAEFGEETELIKHFSCDLGGCVCNINCSYCYINWMDEKLKQNAYFPHSIPFMLKAVSKKRLGGPAFFNMCGEGETMLKPGIIELVRGLLEEGHYVGLITNGTVTKKLEELLCFDEELKRRLLVHCSLHYLELKRCGSLDTYFDNVNRLRDGNISVAMTMPGGDEYIPYIQEIRDICLQKAGRLPVISPIRRETNFKEEFPLGSQLTWEEYCETWKPFNSTSIEMRNRTYGNFAGLCYAGMSSGWIDFVTGNMRSCVPGEYMDNIYEDISRKIKFKTECHLCDKGFCSHNNMFLSKRQNETGTLLSWYECFNNIDRNGNSTYSDDMRKATDYCCDY